MVVLEESRHVLWSDHALVVDLHVGRKFRDGLLAPLPIVQVIDRPVEIEGDVALQAFQAFDGE